MNKIKENKVYFITDPCYIIPSKMWDKIGKQSNWKFEGAVPIEVEGFTIKVIIGTPSGDGSYENIGVDSGMLCLAGTTEAEAKKQRFGKIIYGDYWEAKRELYSIATHF